MCSILVYAFLLNHFRKACNSQQKKVHAADINGCPARMLPFFCGIPIFSPTCISKPPLDSGVVNQVSGYRTQAEWCVQLLESRLGKWVTILFHPSFPLAGL